MSAWSSGPTLGSYGRPEVILLYKAKHSYQSKNQKDFEAAFATASSLSAAGAGCATPFSSSHPGHGLAREPRRRRAVTGADVIDERRLVELALRLVSTPSFTGSEQPAAELMRDELADLGLRVQWQQVEDERANVLGTWEGAGGGPTLMLNGHLDTSYSGREPWLQGIPGFRPAGFERDGRIYGLGISNMKGRALLLRRGGARAAGGRAYV